MPRKLKDFDAAVEQREPHPFRVKGRDYELPGDPPVSVVARIIGAQAEGGLNVELAEAHVALARAELDLAVIIEADGPKADQSAVEARIAEARATVGRLTEEMNHLIVELLGKANADQMIADGVGFYTYNRVLRWVPVAYGLRNEEEADPAEAARVVLEQLRSLPTTKDRPELQALLDQFDAVIAEEAGPKANGVKAARRPPRQPQDRLSKTTGRASGSRRSSNGG